MPGQEDTEKLNKACLNHFECIEFWFPLKANPDIGQHIVKDIN